MAQVARDVLARVGGAFSTCMFGPPKHDQETERERWDSRFAFILAACGSAIGLGNLWRFPALAFDYGGGAFFVPYIMALFFIGIPMTILEVALGQVVQSGDIACFGSMHRRLRGVGFGSVFGAYMVVCYYNVIITWACVYLVNSFKDPIPWDVGNDVTGEAVFQPAGDFLDNVVLGVTGTDTEAEVIRGDLFGALIFVWVAIAFIVWKGVSRTSKVVYVTMIVPLITLLILLIRGATLEGASIGISQYIGQWDFSVLQDGLAWTDAVGQIFFSIGVTFGTMTAYASYNSRFQNTVSDAIIIACTNSTVSIVAGFAVFSVLGWLSQRSGIPLTDPRLSERVSGPSLAFVTYPQALAELPGANFFNVLFFLTLFFLGIDSAFSLVEAVCTAVKDSINYHHISRGMITAAVCITGFFIGCIYITNIGLWFLDIVDAYVSNISMLFIGFMETFSTGWIYRIDEHVQISGFISVWLLMASWIATAVLGTLIGTLSQAWIGLLVAAILCAGGTGLAAYLAEHNVPDDEDSPFRNSSRMWTFFMFPIESLRHDLNAVIKQDGDGFDPDSKWAIPLVWSFFIRYFIPPVLIILLGVGIDGYVAAGGYEGLPAKFQVMGILVALTVVSLVVAPIFRPSLVAGWIPAALSGAQALGALKPVRDEEDEEKKLKSATTKEAGSEISSNSQLSLSISAAGGEEIELQAPNYTEDGAVKKTKTVATDSSSSDLDASVDKPN